MKRSTRATDTELADLDDDAEGGRLAPVLTGSVALLALAGVLFWVLRDTDERAPSVTVVPARAPTVEAVDVPPDPVAPVDLAAPTIAPESPVESIDAATSSLPAAVPVPPVNTPEGVEPGGTIASPEPTDPVAPERAVAPAASGVTAGQVDVPTSYPIGDAPKFFVPREERRPGNLGGPPPLDFPGGPNDPALAPPDGPSGAPPVLPPAPDPDEAPEPDPDVAPPPDPDEAPLPE